ncbi:MAG: tRNA (adenosine(37)-N6)-threonylcarbamoyltransferase complex ATPase subunit type 1 TsaE [Chitinophagaceae bacterium]|jgi:tRNA threonylcarbamoyladenosine biosynthesis protein TsaE|nr:tRNA (adenosine(37)-N6)-threonylcarbamoyltransferase complex ATPase subunit type 1 TsaE [Chitinophagaceae bacterium]MCA6471933.1 tRNA (adenosine(37)-N6)-threonylcarbamoyltransferase complex ATPase subunit type 1 TsaE [Chitinophagaceae bacterium]MCA6476603.1 tRNA (adenosine(37)-N6)-threonylcarbamoyltransferase complex ATPase subunit type 1 TsaE [Chitinophagaceae bacterium]MCA6497178.1 tRNA (adenosine(37)-N6)-threonylcarbamoyltransferase complex ATPase subunit type 1 TsaE [Chitinophagaceae bact
MNKEYSFDHLSQVAEQLWEEGKNYRVWAIHGDMGAGKTTLVIQLCRLLGIDHPAGSPTFSIINEYRLPNGEVLCHMDWYRLRDSEEAIQAGVEDRLLGEERCWIEWPERAEDLLPSDTFHVYLGVENATTRHIKTM